MTASARPASQEAGLRFSAAPILAGMLVCAPLIKGGNRPLPLLMLELAALGLLVHMALRPTGITRHVPRLLLAVLALMALLPLLQLIPLPQALWSSLPGRDVYAESLAAAGVEMASEAWSLVPRATEAAFLTLLPPLAVFLATATLADSRLKTLLRVFVAVAVFQALVGLAQYGTGSMTILTPSDIGRIRNAFGTYANYDHLAALLEMALPITLALLAAILHPAANRPSPSRSTERTKPARGPIAFAEDRDMSTVVLFVAAAIVILLGIAFTRSRTGVGLGMLAIVLCALAFARPIGGGRSARLTTVLTVAGLILAIEIGLAPVLARFANESVIADMRWPVFEATIAGIRQFFPFGSGIGTFPEVFRSFQPGEVPKFVNHAHNDYLELLFEAGAFGAVIIAGALACYLWRWPQLWRAERWSELRFAQVAAGISLLLVALHSLLDFNLHIPANAIFIAFLAGTFFHREAEGPKPRPERARAPNHPAAPAPVPQRPPPRESTPNPFAE